jgi:hypothetical protein
LKAAACGVFFCGKIARTGCFLLQPFCVKLRKIINKPQPNGQFCPRRIPAGLTSCSGCSNQSPGAFYFSKVFTCSGTLAAHDYKEKIFIRFVI